MTTRRYDNDTAEDSARFLRDQEAAARRYTLARRAGTRQALSATNLRGAA